MPFKCLDCSHTARQFPGGACPACGSHNARSTVPRSSETKARNKALRPVILVVVWGIFLVLLYRKLGGG